MIRTHIVVFFILSVLAFNTPVMAQPDDDLDPPVLSLVAPYEGSFSGSLEFSARSSDDMSEVESVEFGYGSSEVGLTWFSSSGGQDGYWSSSLDTTDLADGYYNVSLRSTDSSGNQRILFRVAEILMDNDPPVVSLVAPESGTFNGSLEFSATSTDDLSGVENVEFGYRPVGGKLKWFFGREAEKGVWQGSLDTTRIQDGSYSLSVRSTDFAGNREVASDVWEIVVDNQESLDYEEDDVQVEVSGVVTASDLAYKISAGSTARFVFRRSGLPVSSVSFKASEEVRNVRVTVSGRSERPSQVSVVNDTVYRYVTLNNSNVADSLVSSLAVGFRVDKDFVSDNNASEDEVFLLWYDGGQWVEAETRLNGSAGGSYSYEASPGGFGYYVVVLRVASGEEDSEQSSVVVEPDVEDSAVEEPPELPKPEDVVPEGPDRGWVLYTVMAVIVIILLVGGVIVFVHMRPGRFSHEAVEDPDDAGESFSNSLADGSTNSEYKF